MKDTAEKTQAERFRAWENTFKILGDKPKAKQVRRNALKYLKRLKATRR